MYDREFEVESDHKPLKNIFRKPISETPARIARFLMQLQKYDFKVKYMPGKKMYISDILSRMNLPGTEECIPDIDINQLQLNAHLFPDFCGLAILIKFKSQKSLCDTKLGIVKLILQTTGSISLLVDDSFVPEDINSSVSVSQC